MTLTVTNISSPFAYRIISDTDSDATAEENITGTSGSFYSIEIDNTANGTACHTKLHDGLPDGGVVVGTTDPNWVFFCPASSKTLYTFPDGIAFSTALNMWTVVEAGTGGTTSPSLDVTVVVVTN